MISKYRRLLFLILLSTLVIGAMVTLPRRGRARYGKRLHSAYQRAWDISLAIKKFERDRGHYPKRVFLKDGNLHSWRIEILPYLGHDELYSSYRFDEPWDGESNKLLQDKMPSVFRCEKNADLGLTRFVAISGKKTIWADSTDDVKRSSVMTNDEKHAGMLVESKAAVRWMSPEDMTFDDLSPDAVVQHKGGKCVIGFADGTAQARCLNAAELDALFDINNSDNATFESSAIK